MIGLSATAADYERRGYSPERQAHTYQRFRWRGMPFATTPRKRMHGTWPMCRVIVAARLVAPEREWAVLRALQFAQFTSTLALEDDGALAEALREVPDIDPAELIAAAHEPETEARFEADRAEARTAAGSATEFQGKAAATDGPVRYTAPSVIFTAADGRKLEAGGFQPVEAYDVLIANLDRSLERRAPAEDAGAVLAEFPDGLTTAEVAAVMAPNNVPPDRDAAENDLIDVAAAGRARRRAYGNDALWVPARSAVRALRSVA
jgi:hypothetical protein